MSKPTAKQRQSESENLNSETAPIQDGSRIDQDAATTESAPAVPANGQPASNGQGDGAAHIPVDGAGRDTDPYNLDALRLSQNFAAAAGVKKIITTVPVRKPSKEVFIRAHPDPGYRLDTLVLESKEDRETYLIAPRLWEELATEPTVSSRLLVTAITRQRVLFVWPIRLPGSNGRIDEWSRSAMEAADLAREQWVRVTPNMANGAYDLGVAANHMAEPQWPELTFQEIIRIAFRNKMIDTWEHPILRRLRGED
jgi:hypothetical protein